MLENAPVHKTQVFMHSVVEKSEKIPNNSCCAGLFQGHPQSLFNPYTEGVKYL